MLAKLETTFFKGKIEEAPLSVIGQTLATIKKIDHRYSKKLYRDSFRTIQYKFQITKLKAIAKCLTELNGVDDTLTKDLVDEMNIADFREEINLVGVMDLAIILTGLYTLDISKAYLLFNSIEEDSLLKKIETEITKFQDFAEVASKLRRIDELKVMSIYKKVDIDKLAVKLGNQASKLPPRAFLQSVGALSKIAFEHTCKIINYVDKRYFLTSILPSIDLKYYVKFIPNIIRIFEYNSSTQMEVLYGFSEYIKQHYDILEENVGVEMAKETFDLIKKYLK